MDINGNKVVDAKKTVVLEITPKDIAKGDNKDPGSCAAAQACMRQLGATHARVHVARTYLKIGESWQRFATSKALRSEIIAFDRGGAFEPGEYQLIPLKPSARVTGKTQGAKNTKAQKAARKGKPKIARVKYHAVTGIRAHGANR